MSFAREALIKAPPRRAQEGDVSNHGASVDWLESPAWKEDSQSVQAAIRTIRGIAADIRKQVRLASTSAKLHVPKLSGTAHETVRTARSRAEEARRVLQRLQLQIASSVSVESGGEQDMLRLTQKKLSDNLSSAAAELENSWKAYQAAEAYLSAEIAAGERHGTVNFQAQDLEIGQGGVQHSSQSSQQLQAADADTVTMAEVEMHAAIAAEYVRDATALSRNMGSLQRSLLDLAQFVSDQGIVLDNVEANMAQSSDTTRSAAQQIEVSAERQSTATRRLCKLVCFGATVAMATVSVVALHS